jgi:LysR family transcriptional activator of nhaA
LVGEFYDPAFVNVLAQHGLGFVAVPTIVVRETVGLFDFGVIGRVRECQQQFYAITPERKLTHPAVTAITSDTRGRLFR